MATIRYTAGGGEGREGQGEGQSRGRRGEGRGGAGGGEGVRVRDKEYLTEFAGDCTISLLAAHGCSRWAVGRVGPRRAPAPRSGTGSWRKGTWQRSRSTRCYHCLYQAPGAGTWRRGGRGGDVEERGWEGGWGGEVEERGRGGDVEERGEGR